MYFFCFKTPTVIKTKYSSSIYNNINKPCQSKFPPPSRDSFVRTFPKRPKSPPGWLSISKFVNASNPQTVLIDLRFAPINHHCVPLCAATVSRALLLTNTVRGFVWCLVLLISRTYSPSPYNKTKKATKKPFCWRPTHPTQQGRKVISLRELFSDRYALAYSPTGTFDCCVPVPVGCVSLFVAKMMNKHFVFERQPLPLLPELDLYRHHHHHHRWYDHLLK